MVEVRKFADWSVCTRKILYPSGSIVSSFDPVCERAGFSHLRRRFPPPDVRKRSESESAVTERAELSQAERAANYDRCR